jgi:hypothetical protein
LRIAPHPRYRLTRRARRAKRGRQVRLNMAQESKEFKIND